jgi:phenylalanyl-tRNA synthetase alpha chain
MTSPDNPLASTEAEVARCEEALAAAPSEHAARAAFAQFGGQSGAAKRAITAAIAAAPKEKKREVGQLGNALLGRMQAALDRRLGELRAGEAARDLERAVDVTLPGRGRRVGHLHPVTHARRAIERIFARLGFALATGPQVETDFYNFEALAMPKDHPARDMQDTFYVADEPDVVLRTHTSPVQIRTMLSQPPPVRVICLGAVFRRDDDPTHVPMFHQVEGLMVDERVTFAELKGTLLHFARAFFGPQAGIRLRPSFFPFTEPSAELDISCVFCGGKGCRTCKGTGFIEVGGAGMVDPEVFRQVGYDAEKYTGFAFGFGIDRMAMLKYDVSDLRLLFEGDQRILEQFP